VVHSNFSHVSDFCVAHVVCKFWPKEKLKATNSFRLDTASQPMK